MPERASYVPRELLIEPEAWRTSQPSWRDDVAPSTLAAAQLQHRLARELRTYIKDQGWDRQRAAEHLSTSRANLWRLLEGQAPITLINAVTWAAALDMRLTLGRASS